MTGGAIANFASSEFRDTKRMRKLIPHSKTREFPHNETCKRARDVKCGSQAKASARVRRAGLSDLRRGKSACGVVAACADPARDKTLNGFFAPASL